MYSAECNQDVCHLLDSASSEENTRNQRAHALPTSLAIFVGFSFPFIFILQKICKENYSFEF